MKTRAPNRRGMIYLLVLLTAAFVVATGLAALALETRTDDRVDLHTELSEARVAARSAMDLAIESLNADPVWRTSAGGDGMIYSGTVPAGEHSFSVAVFAIDDDGLLTDDEGDPFELKVRVLGADTKRQIRATVEPRPIPMDVLELGVYAVGRLRLASTTTVSGDTSLGSSGRLEGGDQTLTQPLESETQVRNIATTDDSVVVSSGREVPSAAIVDRYALAASDIDVGQLPTDGGAYVIERVAIGPGMNPYGSPNAAGLYKVDQGSNTLIVRNARILGTLIAVGSGDVVLEGSVEIVPQATNYPALLTAGTLRTRTTGQTLSELSLGVNLNPGGLLDGGLLDLDLLDTYEDRLAGIVFSVGDLIVESGVLTAEASVVTLGQFDALDTTKLNVTDDRDTRLNPPPGFESALGERYHVTGWLDPN